MTHTSSTFELFFFNCLYCRIMLFRPWCLYHQSLTHDWPESLLYHYSLYFISSSILPWPLCPAFLLCYSLNPFLATCNSSLFLLICLPIPAIWLAGIWYLGRYRNYGIDSDIVVFWGSVQFSSRPFGPFRSCLLASPLLPVRYTGNEYDVMHEQTRMTRV